jgi:hypothetical protein
MDLIKQYITQSISAASNNLRLSTQKIEVVALLRDTISRSADLENDIKEMKKITELSKFAIRLHEIYNYLTQPYIDFFKISEKFREHSQYLIRDLSTMLDSVNPVSFNAALGKLHQESGEIKQNDTRTEEAISIDFTKREADQAVFEKETEKEEKSIFSDEEKNEDEFHNYERQILGLIKPLDEFLQNLREDNIDSDTLQDFREKVQRNGELSSKIGFDIIAGMHNIIYRGLDLINSGTLKPEKNTIESIRACLIVIVAVVKGKEIDITGYLNRAEDFGNEINKLI